jgi:hypothetical protein
MNLRPAERPRTRAHRAAILALVLPLLLAGCAYHLGPTGGRRAGQQTVQVQTVVNETVEPRLVAALGQALREQIQRDGTFRLQTHGDADILLSSTIVKFDRQFISVKAGDSLTPRDYRILITARIVARERGTGRVLLDRELVGRTEVRAGSDLHSAEREAIPMAADFLATSATSLLADGKF